MAAMFPVTVGSVTVFAPHGNMSELCGEVATDDARYHIFFDPTSLVVSPPTMFKNPPRGIKYRTPDYFDTRRLNCKAVQNAKLIETIFQTVREHNLVQQIAEAMRAHDQQVERAAYVRQQVRRYWIARMRSQEPPMLTDISDDEFNTESLRLSAERLEN